MRPLIIMDLPRFQTELGYDFLEIHDGPNLLSPLVGSFNGTQVPQFLFSSSNFLYLLFTTDNSRSNVGFKILYESESGEFRSAFRGSVFTCIVGDFPLASQASPWTAIRAWTPGSPSTGSATARTSPSAPPCRSAVTRATG